MERSSPPGSDPKLDVKDAQADSTGYDELEHAPDVDEIVAFQADPERDAVVSIHDGDPDHEYEETVLDELVHETGDLDDSARADDLDAPARAEQSTEDFDETQDDDNPQLNEDDPANSGIEPYEKREFAGDFYDEHEDQHHEGYLDDADDSLTVSTTPIGTNLNDSGVSLSCGHLDPLPKVSFRRS